MNNIIKFTKQEYCDCLNNLLTIKAVIDNSINNPDTIILRRQYRPIYINPQVDEAYSMADRYIDGVIVGLFKALDEYTPEQLFAKSDLPELLVNNIADIDEGKPTTITIPFQHSIASIILIPYGDIWIIPDVFIDLNSSFQEGINFTCKQMGTTREDLFSGRYEPN